MKKLKIKPKSLKWNLFGERGRIGRVKLQSMKSLHNFEEELIGKSKNSSKNPSGIFKIERKPIESSKKVPLGFQK